MELDLYYKKSKEMSLEFNIACNFLKNLRFLFYYCDVVTSVTEIYFYVSVFCFILFKLFFMLYLVFNLSVLLILEGP